MALDGRQLTVDSVFSALARIFQGISGWVGAGSGNRTRILSLEGCCTTIVLYPRSRAGRGLFSIVFRGVVGEAGLEPAKAYASGFTVRPLCHSGHSPSALRAA